MKHTLYILFSILLFTGCTSDRESLSDLIIEEQVVVREIEIDSISFILENSASMKGYIEATGKNKLSSIFRGLESGFLNSKKDFFVANQIVSIKPNLPKEIGDYSKLKDDWSNKSDHELILKHSIKKVSGNNCVVLFTDGIYSIDGQDLEYVSSEIKKAYYKALSKNEVEVLIYKFLVPFSGTYYSEAKDCKSNNFLYNGTRPIYMFVFGKPKVIKKFQEEPDTKRIVKEFNPLSTRFFLTKNYNSKYKVLKKEVIGTLVSGKYGTGGRQGKAGNIVSEAHKSNSDVFQFAFAIDFSEIGLTNEYIENLENYNISSGDYDISQIIPLSELDNKVKLKIQETYQKDNFSHVFVLNSKNDAKTYFGELKIDMKNNATDLSNEINSDCSPEDIDSLNTITFSSLMEGIKRSYENINQGKLLTELIFNIKIDD